MNTLVSLPIGSPEEEAAKKNHNKKELLEFYSKHMEAKKERERLEKEQDKELLFKQQQILLQR